MERLVVTPGFLRLAFTFLLLRALARLMSGSSGQFAALLAFGEILGRRQRLVSVAGRQHQR
jgi:hypothetical protein